MERIKFFDYDATAEEKENLALALFRYVHTNKSTDN